MPFEDDSALNVLVVDDDSALLRTLSDILRMRGCEPETASTGQEGLLLAQRMLPAVALVDLRLPDMDGLELIARLRAASLTTEVIILTGNASLDSAVKAMRQQSFDYLIKPVRPDDLFKSLDRAGQRFFRHRAEAALRQSEEQLRRVFSAVHDGLLIVDGSNRVVQANASAVRIIAIPPDELVGLKIDAILGPLESAGDPRSSTDAVRQEVRITHRTGEPRHLEVTASRFAPDRTVYTIRDVTEQRDMQERLRIGQKMEALGQLAGAVAHDFNNVLTAIRGYADLVHEQLPQGTISEEVDEIRKASDRATSLTRQLLSFSRRQVLQPVRIDLRQALHDLEGMLTRLVREDIALKFEATPCVVEADPTQLEQIFLNLVVNARDAMPEGGRITVEAGCVEESGGEADFSEAEAGSAYIRVSDTGAGIPEDVLPHIFEPFFTTKDAGKGTGFGLSTIHGIVQQLGGSIRVSSKPGRTSFVILLPRADGIENGRERKPEELGEPPRGTERILLVEDDPSISKVMARYLTRCGYDVQVAATGGQGLHLLEVEERFHLLVTDVVLPDINGWDVARLAEETQPDIRVLYISGYAEEEVGNTVIAPGTAYIPKPFTGRELALRVRSILDGNEPARPH